jgi:hypothetical protein
VTKEILFATALVAVNLSTIGIASAASAALPATRTQGEATFVTGGVGIDEARAMRAAEKHYPLSLLLVERAKPRDEFLAAVDVKVTNGKGETQLQTTSDGPYVLMSLPDGRYTITAEHDGKTLTRQATVKAGKPEQLVFAW